MAQNVYSFTVSEVETRKEAERQAQEFMECMGYSTDDSFTSKATGNTTYHVLRNVDVSVWFYERNKTYNVTVFRFARL